MSRRLIMEAAVMGLVASGLLRPMTPGEKLPERPPPAPKPFEAPQPNNRQARRKAARAAAKAGRSP